MSECFIIPIYNHHQTIGSTVAALQPFKQPVVIVDDGSDLITRQTLQQLAQQYDDITLVTLPHNSGKGAAVMAGMQHAWAAGFTHAIQVDADGQHNLQDIPQLRQLSAQHPQALISGAPVYDDSIPTGRKIGRYITHFWVWVETLSFSVRDTMCGFRVYPLASCIHLMQQVQLGTRMDFDIEIMVRLYWQGVQIHFIPTKVIYPQGGCSHFKALYDNWLISKMHTVLFFGMLKRLPQLLSHKQRRTNVAAD
jgi:glycosyltransferase involved in cell wall biosynthesis